MDYQTLKLRSTFESYQRSKKIEIDSMKTKHIFLIAMLVTGSLTMAQRGGGQGSPLQRIENEKKSVMAMEGITESQEKEIEEVYETFSTSIKELRNDDSRSMQDKRPEMKKLREEKDAKMKALLTESQYKSYTELTTKQGGGKRRKRNG